MPYQPAAVAALCAAITAYGAAADGSDTGIGKTYHAIAVCRTLNLRPAIVCRKIAITSWAKCCEHFKIKPVFISNWERVRSRFQYIRKGRDRMGRPVYQWDYPKGTLLIFDEAHMAANPKSQNHAVWIAGRGLASLSLSATFADRPARLQGLFYILNILHPEKFRAWLISRGAYQDEDEIDTLDTVEDLKIINRVLYPRYGCRITYNDPAVKMFFPEGIYQTEIMDIGGKNTAEQMRLYATTIEQVRHYQEMGKQAEALNADLRYRQAAELMKVDSLAELADNYRDQGLSVCLFVNFLETLRHLAALLKTKSVIFGDQEKYGMDRQAVMNDFQINRTTVIICMIQAGGQSISLHDLHGRPRISLICPTYDPIALKQVFGRIHRAGSKSRPVNKLVYAANTIEEKVAAVVNGKLDNISALMDGDLMEPDLFKLTGR